MLAHKPLIHYIWYLDYLLHDDGTITILKHNRFHRMDNREVIHCLGLYESPIFKLIEDHNRKVISADINGVIREVRNQKHISGYS